MPERVGYLNGQWVPESALRISIYDEWTLYGAGLFEMTRSFHGTPFLLDAHLDRLSRGLRELAIPEPMSQEDLKALCLEVSARNDHGAGEEHRLMINVSRGPLGIYRDAMPQEGPTLCIADFPLSWTTAGMGCYFEEGIRLQTVHQRQPVDLPMHLKHRSRLHFMRANQEIVEPDTWPLLCATMCETDFVTECPGANLVIFGAPGEAAWTPQDHCLPGISLKYLRRMQPVKPAWLEVDYLFEADEMMVTATPFCLLPVVAVDGQPIGDGRPGPRYRDLLARWSEAVGMDIAAQIQGWDAVRPNPVGSSPYQARRP